MSLLFCTVCWLGLDYAAGALPAIRSKYDNRLNETTYRNNWSLRFQGQQWIKVPHAQSMNAPLINSFTVEAWVRPLPAQRVGNIKSGETSVIVAFPNRHPSLEMTETGTLLAKLRDADGQTYEYEAKNVSLLDGNWHHVAVTWDDIRLKMYVDGKLDGGVKEPRNEGYHIAATCAAPASEFLEENEVSTMEIASATECEEGMSIGGHYCCSGRGYSGRFFIGEIDEVRVWTRALEAATIAKNKDSPLAARSHLAAGLLYYFPFDDVGHDKGGHIVHSIAADWYGFLGNSSSKGRPHWVKEAAPLQCAGLQFILCQACRAPFQGNVIASGLVTRGYSTGWLVLSIFITMLVTIPATVSSVRVIKSVANGGFHSDQGILDLILACPRRVRSMISR